jgi:predicted DsbA family dithiol-disulfide isomerase
VRLSIDIISDVICPWCFIGKRRLEKALQMFAGHVHPEITWFPFQLNPEMPAGGLEREVYRTAKFGSLERSESLDAEMRRAGAGEGISFAFEKMKRTPNTFLAHRMIWLARREGVQDAVVEALFEAYFSKGLDVGNRDVLVRIASANGIESERARNFLEGGEGKAEVRAEEEWARSLGVSGVPFYVIGGRYAIAGAQPAEAMATTLKEALSHGSPTERGGESCSLAEGSS